MGAFIRLSPAQFDSTNRRRDFLNLSESLSLFAYFSLECWLQTVCNAPEHADLIRRVHQLA